jgi:hypothetical protein
MFERMLKLMRDKIRKKEYVMTLEKLYGSCTKSPPIKKGVTV